MVARMSDQSLSARAEAVSHAVSRILSGFLEEIDYFRRRDQLGVLDFTFGDPREMPPEAYVSALQTAVTPQREDWFAYKQYEPAAQEAAAASLGQLTGLPFEPDDMLLTTGGSVALSLGMKAVADAGDEVIFSLPPWFAYETLLVEAGLVPVKVRIDLETLDLDVESIAAAITPRTRIVIVNTPNNPTAYSYGKTLLSPGQRIGYLALPPALPDREALRRAVHALQIAIGWAFPNAIMQYALPELERQAFDVARLERRRDQMVDALTEMGYQVHRPKGTFYLFPRSPIPDDEVFARLLVEQGILVMPGALFETPGFFRICLTATEETCERSLPGFAAALTQAAAVT
jgi:aspartate aminotransferase